MHDAEVPLCAALTDTFGMHVANRMEQCARFAHAKKRFVLRSFVNVFFYFDGDRRFVPVRDRGKSHSGLVWAEPLNECHVECPGRSVICQCKQFPDVVGYQRCVHGRVLSVLRAHLCHHSEL